MLEWKNQTKQFWQDKLVLLVRCYWFNCDDITLKDLLLNCDGFSEKHLEGIYEFILLNPERVILIFDGLDELSFDTKCLRTDGSVIANAKMPAFTILSMLVKGKLLPDATVLITSRPRAKCAFKLLGFDRTVEILGFFEDQVKEYVIKFSRDDKSIAELILNCINSSPELRRLCYIPINTYIFCRTMKESFINNDYIEDPPKNATELYKKAVKILLWKHHEGYENVSKPNRDNLVKDLLLKLENDMQKMKSLAKKGLEEGNLFFDESHLAEFPNLYNCGVFSQIPDEECELFCFLHSTIQEFLAASCIVDDWQNIGDFLDDKVTDSKWHLVIKFIAGIVGDMKKKKKVKDINSVRKRFEKWISHLYSNEEDSTLGFLGIQCLYELQDKDETRAACTISTNFSDEMFIVRLDI
ncbi:NACHT, LRR and PYD domains-containing protein 3-like isoform X3 [Xenia sp. Carnegie-2017]|uniref:NACHT, LRR and PYD domains-containing protein 3-like isoform X3 n=1 Tax=Xenia sp. Carnegie-2017 TaxID=2897299 RepID=UPI001F04774B|nr:NACHT, LRR and PYD domains-containing protein 3-like isoform X3 [Xenia sp. Carnegie-2017]